MSQLETINYHKKGNASFWNLVTFRNNKANSWSQSKCVRMKRHKSDFQHKRKERKSQKNLLQLFTHQLSFWIWKFTFTTQKIIGWVAFITSEFLCRCIVAGEFQGKSFWDHLSFSGTQNSPEPTAFLWCTDFQILEKLGLLCFFFIFWNV